MYIHRQLPRAIVEDCQQATGLQTIHTDSTDIHRQSTLLFMKNENVEVNKIFIGQKLRSLPIEVFSTILTVSMHI